MKKLGIWMAASTVASLLGGLGGCDDSAEDPGMIPDDGDGEEVVEMDVTIASGIPASLLAVRNSDEPAWRQVAVNDQSEVTVKVHGAYEIAMVCAGTGANAPVTATRFARTVEDAPRLESHCPGAEASVHGKLAQAGQVAIASSGMAMNTTNWPFALPAIRGKYDLLLLRGTPGALDAIAIRRGVQVNGDLDLGTIDLAAETMTPLVESRPTVKNLLDEERGTIRTWLNTGSTGSSISTGQLVVAAPLSTRVVPTAGLLATDRQSVAFTSNAPAVGKPAQSRSRSAAVAVAAGENPEIELPAPMAATSFLTTDQLASASWAELPEKFDRVTFSRAGSGTESNRRQTVVMSANFIKETKASSAHLDFTSVPGFKADWQLDAAKAQTLSLSVSKGEGFFEAGTTSSTVSQQLPGRE